MKRMLSVLFLVTCVVLTVTPAGAVPSKTWDEYVMEVNRKDKVTLEGPKVLEKYTQESNKSEYELWCSLRDKHGRADAVTAVTMINKMFPNGDPSRWNEVTGFIRNSMRPRQLMAIDAFFAALDALSRSDEDIWGAALLLQKFCKSSRGKFMFIDTMPKEARPILDRIVAKTGIKSVWKTSKFKGNLPLCPRYRGIKSRSLVIKYDMQYIDGAGRVASHGTYAWDRDRGYFYYVKDMGNYGSKKD